MLTRPLAVLLLMTGCAAPLELPAGHYHEPPGGYLVATEPSWCRPCRDAASTIATLQPQHRLTRADYRRHRIRALPTVIRVVEAERWTGAEVARIGRPALPEQLLADEPT